jgi:hypothetical protein
MPLAPGGLYRWQAYLIMHPAAFKCTDKNLSTEYKICSFVGSRKVWVIQPKTQKNTHFILIFIGKIVILYVK